MMCQRADAHALRRSATIQVAEAVDALARALGLSGHLNLAFPPRTEMPVDLTALMNRLGTIDEGD